MKKILFTLMLIFSLSGAMADSVEDMCSDSDTICTCAARQLKSGIGDDDYGLYEAIGAAYIANKSAGMNMGDAWDTAVKAESKQRGASFVDTLSRTNAIGNTHRKAIKACTG